MLISAQSAALFAVLILTALVMFQLALAAGASLGERAWGGAHRVLPTRLRVASAMSTVAYALIAVALLAAAGLIDVTDLDEPLRIVTWVLVAFFALGAAMNAISRSRKERVMAIVALALAALSFIVARGG